MQFTVTVEDGVITKINNTSSFYMLAEAMGESALNGAIFPDWKLKAISTLQKVLGVTDPFGLKCLIGYNIPATQEYVKEILYKLITTFVMFKEEFEIPKVLPNGDYSLATIVGTRR